MYLYIYTYRHTDKLHVYCIILYVIYYIINYIFEWGMMLIVPRSWASNGIDE